MPKSKRNKVITLSKVKKKDRSLKDKTVESIHSACEKFSRCYLIDIENERNTFMQEIRKKLRPGIIIHARDKVMQLALGMTPEQECQDNIHKIAQRISGKCCLLFTDMKPTEVEKIFADYRPLDYARQGAIATETVTLSKGVDALARLPHSIEAHLRQLGLPTQLREGKIFLLGDHVVCKKDQQISADQAQILKLMEIQQARFMLSIEAHWKKGGEFVDCDVMED